MNFPVKEFEKRYAIHDEDEALLEPRLQAYVAKSRAIKSGDARLVDDANARLSELEKLR